MRQHRQPSPATVLAVAFCTAVAIPALVERSGPIGPAQAQTDADKKKGEPERRRTAPPRPQPPPPSAKPPAFKSPQHAPPRATAPPPRVPPHKQAPEKPVKSFQQPPPPAAKSAPAKPPAGFEPRKEGIKRPPPQLIAPAPSKEPPPAVKKGAPPPKELPPGVKKAAPPTAKPPAQGPALKRLEERRERVEDGGPRKVLPKPGKRLIVKERDRSIIRHDHAERFLRLPGAKSERKSDGRVETYYVRPDGVRVVTVVDRHGRLLRRFRRHRDGREYSIIDNRRFYQALGIAAIGIIVLNLPPPHVTIPLESYIVDYESASDDDLYETLAAPPIENLGRAYSLDEILDNEELRARMRRVDVDSITFEFGSSEVPPDQYDKLERIARAILRVLRDNPQAVFLLAGHTDAPGDPDNNLTLSDQRAQSVAAVLSEAFDVPPENLVTQGYGEQYLKIDTEEPEPRNRRVSVISIGALMAER